jgi:hypothetical protein
VLVVERETVRGDVAPLRQRMRDDEERRLQDRDADRVRVDPAAGAGPSNDRGEGGELATAAIVGDSAQRWVAVDDPGGQIDVVAVAVGSNRRPGAPGGVDEDISGDTEQCRREECVSRAKSRRGSVSARQLLQS